MNKRGRKRLKKDLRHESTDILEEITKAMEVGAPRVTRADLIDGARRSGASLREITNATIEGIRRWKPASGERVRV